MEHLERPDWYDEAGAWRDRMAWSDPTALVRQFDRSASEVPTLTPMPAVRVTVRNVPNDGV